MTIRRIVVAALLMSPIPTAAAPYRSSPPRQAMTDRDWGPWLGPFRRGLMPALMQDFGERYLYAPANAALAPPRPGERRVVFIGDSITDNWDLAASFPGRPYVNRGIGSQVTAQMLVRFRQDVVALHPRAVVILGGVNDVQGVLQRETPQTIVDNIAAMADIADANRIRVVLCALLPVNDYTPPARGMLTQRDPRLLREVSARLAALARRRGYAFADYAPPMTDARGLLRAELTVDGIHPLAAGYSLMAPIAEAAIARSLHGSDRFHLR